MSVVKLPGTQKFKDISLFHEAKPIEVFTLFANFVSTSLSPTHSAHQTEAIAI